MSQQRCSYSKLFPAIVDGEAPLDLLGINVDIAEWISMEEVILKLGISENGQISGADYILSTCAHKYTATLEASHMVCTHTET